MKTYNRKENFTEEHKKERINVDLACNVLPILKMSFSLVLHLAEDLRGK